MPNFSFDGDLPDSSMPATEPAPPTVFGAAIALLLDGAAARRDRPDLTTDTVSPGAPISSGPLAEPLAGSVEPVADLAAQSQAQQPDEVAFGTNAPQVNASVADALHPLDVAKLEGLPTRLTRGSDNLTEPVRAGTPHPVAVAAAGRERDEVDDEQRVGAAASRSLLDDRTPQSRRGATVPSEPLPVNVDAPASVVEARAAGEPGGDAPPPAVRPAPAPLIELVEFDAGSDGVTRLRLIHESVGRLHVTLDAGERTDVRLTSDDAAVRQTLADALPTLRRLADDRHLPLGTLEVTASHTPADGRGRDAPADRRPAPAPAPTSAPRPTPRSTPSAGRSAGLFA